MSQKYWLFQAIPEKFDLLGFFNTHPTEVRWLVQDTQKNLIKKGDCIFFWLGVGKGTDFTSGVVGAGEVISNPALMLQDEPAMKFWKDAKMYPNSERIRVNCKIFKFWNPNPDRSRIKSDSILKSMGIMSFAQGTNFELSKVEVEKIGQILKTGGVI